MRCPKCKSLLRVADTRVRGISVRRRRQCGACQHVLATVELPIGKTWWFRMRMGVQGPEIAKEDDVDDDKA